MRVTLKRSLAGFLAMGVVAAGAVLLGGQTAGAQPAVKLPQLAANKEAAPAIKPGSVDAKSGAPLGATQLRSFSPATGATPNSADAGNDNSVDFSAQYNYCYGSLTYTTVRNFSAVTKYYEVVLYNSGQSRTFYSSVTANSYAYPTFYGTMGAWTAYLYVWNGSSYAYDEYLTGNNTCSLSWSFTKTIYSGYYLASVTNNGTAYASTEVAELAPYPAYGTYTGTHWYSPAAGGGSISQYVYVGVGIQFGVDINPAAGSTYYPSHYTGTY